MAFVDIKEKKEEKKTKKTHGPFYRVAAQLKINGGSDQELRNSSSLFIVGGKLLSTLRYSSVCSCVAFVKWLFRWMVSQSVNYYSR